MNMLKIFIFSAALCLAASPAFCQADDTYWSNRITAGGAEKGYEYYKELYSGETNYENAWKFARSAHYYADNFLTKDDIKKTVFTEAKKAAEEATNLSPGGVEGHFYLGIAVGSWAELNGVLDSLSSVDVIIKEMTRVVEIDPSFEQGSGYMVRGRVYHLAPAIISAGDRQKAESDYEKAIEYGPENRMAYRFYAELLMDFDRKKASDIIAKGLAIPPDTGDPPQDRDEISHLKQLQSRL
jgi:tetratricopeptide (TPR) repeat protein